MDQETGRPAVGFVGLGVMGHGMAADVRKHGYPLWKSGPPVPPPRGTMLF